MTLLGAFEVLGVSSIFPFMAVVAKPEVVESSEWLGRIYGFLNVSSSNQFLLYLGGVVLAMILISNIFAAFVSRAVLRFSHGLRHGISVRLLRMFVNKPYEFFLSRNSAALTLSVIGQVDGLVSGVVLPALQTIAKAIVATMLLCLLMVIDPLLALCVALVAGSFYTAIFFAVKGRLSVFGHRTALSDQQRHRLAVDTLLSIKELKILHREPYYLRRFESWSNQYSSDLVGYGLISTLPRYAIEIIAFGGILVILLYLIALQRDLSQALPLIALYAVAGYRLMPAIQQIFGGIAQVRFGLGSLRIFYPDLEELRKAPFSPVGRSDTEFAFDRDVTLRDIVFRYAGATRTALDGVTLEIRKNTTVGIVGATGSGKTTAIDVLLGLLKPQQGALCIDGAPVSGAALAAWQRRIGYVPQAPHIIDDTIRRNVALAIPDDEIDDSRVRNALRLANLDEFVQQHLAEGYDAHVGERGAKLSGGQRQRLCIARALYHDPDVLVFDEATSALDAQTEDAIIEAIRALAHRKTIIMIAHKLGSLADCDSIYVFEQGRIVDHGSYQALRDGSLTFRALARFGIEA